MTETQYNRIVEILNDPETEWDDYNIINEKLGLCQGRGVIDKNRPDHRFVVVFWDEQKITLIIKGECIESASLEQKNKLYKIISNLDGEVRRRKFEQKKKRLKEEEESLLINLFGI